MDDGSLNCGNRHFGRFSSCDLDLDPMTFTYELDIYFLEIYGICNGKYELPTSKAVALKMQNVKMHDVKMTDQV